LNKIESIIKSLPGKPGVYQFYDINGKILYVGKAKSLKNRVSSYFNGQVVGKTAVLVKKIADIQYIIVETELDALLLENNLIKEYQPRYNILLKDDKTYPWICIKNERFPRMFPTRNIIKDGSLYFGPYASVKMMHTVLDLVKQLYPLRTCNYQLSEENIQKGKFKVCLEYHIGNCKGPCEGLQKEADYNTAIDEIKYILKGNINQVLKHLKERMSYYSSLHEFEKALVVKDKIEALEKYQGKSMVVNPSISDVEVYSIIPGEEESFVNYLKVINGAIIQGHSVELKKNLDESVPEQLAFAITQLRERFGSDSTEIITPFKVPLEIPGITFTIPVRGDKHKLLQLSERNARYFQVEKYKQISLTDPDRHTNRILEQAMKDLRLKEPPKHIECFDNSNIQGTYPVAACVVFKDAKPSKKDYRHFNIKTVEGPNDYASMEEVVYRRYKRMLEENSSLPQLIVIDGGKGQLSSAVKSLENLGLRGRIAIIGIAKRLEEIYYPDDSIPLYLDKRSETLKLIQHLRNEAHRFGITHHRSKREKDTIKSELTEIPGVSFKTTQKLLWHFKSVKKVKEATEEELAKVIGKSKGKIVFGFFRKG
jgi:excinuclease ABC subunit C